MKGTVIGPLKALMLSNLRRNILLGIHSDLDLDMTTHRPIDTLRSKVFNIFPVTSLYHLGSDTTRERSVTILLSTNANTLG